MTHQWDLHSGYCSKCGAYVMDLNVGACPGTFAPVGAPVAGTWTFPPILAPDLDEEPQTPTAGPLDTKKLCISCDRDWCEYLDAYYGDEWPERDQCAKCRRLKRPAFYLPTT